MVSGYNVLQQWLKIYFYKYKRTQFTKENYLELLYLFYQINEQLKIVKELDDDVLILLDNPENLLTYFF